jgi:hypothetical protein
MRECETAEQSRVGLGSFHPNLITHLAVLSPFVLATDLLFLFRSEVVRDVERFPDLLWRLALDHVGHGLAANIEKGLDVEVICGL